MQQLARKKNNHLALEKQRGSQKNEEGGRKGHQRKKETKRLEEEMRRRKAHGIGKKNRGLGRRKGRWFFSERKFHISDGLYNILGS